MMAIVNPKESVFRLKVRMTWIGSSQFCELFLPILPSVSVRSRNWWWQLRSTIQIQFWSLLPKRILKAASRKRLSFRQDLIVRYAKTFLLL
ncbi:hypothetical protein WI80_11755 [Burkholderia ubonensis]|nr:hypothetical protein WI80_11755 [Burkholderia ubonensis]KVU10732.1 hypothetical protein WK63_24880 [Burkholderia ubonensis]KWB57365.1 hypothetical protein WL38_29825 [Burkholderia ubonensis]